MSKRVDSLRFGLPHRGHSLGEAWLCFRFFTTSRKLWSVFIGVLWGSLRWALLFGSFYCISMLSFG